MVSTGAFVCRAHKAATHFLPAVEPESALCFVLTIMDPIMIEQECYLGWAKSSTDLSELKNVLETWACWETLWPRKPLEVKGVRVEVGGANLELEADPSQLIWVRFQGCHWGLVLVHPELLQGFGCKLGETETLGPIFLLEPLSPGKIKPNQTEKNAFSFLLQYKPQGPAPREVRALLGKPRPCCV